MRTVTMRFPRHNSLTSNVLNGFSKAFSKKGFVNGLFSQVIHNDYFMCQPSFLSKSASR